MTHPSGPIHTQKVLVCACLRYKLSGALLPSHQNLQKVQVVRRSDHGGHYSAVCQVLHLVIRWLHCSGEGESGVGNDSTINVRGRNIPSKLAELLNYLRGIRIHVDAPDGQRGHSNHGKA